MGPRPFSINHSDSDSDSLSDSKLNGVVFLDLKKVFDLINHQILLKEMKTYELSDKTI